MNKIILIGNLTREPELTETGSGIKVCRFSIAVNRNYSDTSGERKVDFFSCIAWRGLGENIAKYARKGNKVCVVGSIEIREYEDKTGAKRNAIDVICQDCEFLTPKNANETGGGFGYPGENVRSYSSSGYSGSNNYSSSSSYSHPSTNKARPQLTPIDDDDEKIPF